jgi:probable HAF family extracellular repeat protein
MARNAGQIASTLATAMILAGAASAQTGASFTRLGDLPGGDLGSQAFGVSPDGAVVVGCSESASGQEAFRWDRENGIAGLGELAGGDLGNCAYAASQDGSVIVGASQIESWDPWGVEAFRWELGSGMVALSDPPVRSFALGVSADGATIVGVTMIFPEAFRWDTEGGMVGLGGSGVISWSTAVTADGAVVIGSLWSQDGVLPFRWDADNGKVVLGEGSGPSFFSGASDVSADGTVIVGASESAPGMLEAVIINEGSPVTPLGQSPDTQTWAQGVSADGLVVVGGAYSFSDLDARAMVWDVTNGTRDLRDVLVSFGLQLDGWTLTEATDISDDGRTIVGYGENPAGAPEAWVAVLPPACSDGIDNDWDGAVDSVDPGCFHPASDREDPACNDELDNDSDGLVDLEDPFCRGLAWSPWEERWSCGLGFELALLLAPLGIFRRKSRRT